MRASTSDAGTTVAEQVVRAKRHVPTSLVDVNPFNARCFYDEEVVRRLALSIRAVGQKVPAMAVPSSSVPGRFVLIDGHYRLQAIAAAGLDLIAIEVGERLPNVDMFRLSYALNEHHAAHTTVDNALAWGRLLTSEVVSSQAELATIVGKSQSLISKTLRVLQLPHVVLDILMQHPHRFPLKSAYAVTLICRAGAVEQAVRLAKRIASEEVTANDIEREVANARGRVSTKHSRKGVKSVPIKGDVCAGFIKSRSPGRLAIELLFREPAKTSWFVDQLKHLLECAT